MQNDKSPLARGFFFERPREGAPEFVKGKLSIKVPDAIALLKEHENNAGYVNLDLLQSKDGQKLYLTVNTWKPTREAPPPAEPFNRTPVEGQTYRSKLEGTVEYPENELKAEDIPFN